MQLNSEVVAMMRSSFKDALKFGIPAVIVSVAPLTLVWKENACEDESEGASSIQEFTGVEVSCRRHVQCTAR